MSIIVCGKMIGIYELEEKATEQVSKMPCLELTIKLVLSTSVPCVEVVAGKWEEFHCEHMCNKKRSCGRHRCNTRCCVVSALFCELIIPNIILFLIYFQKL